MWNSNDGIDLSSFSVKGLPTLGVGKYTGIFIGATIDEEDKQWVTLSTDKGSHIEQSDLDVSEFKLNDRVEFTIAAKDGAVALLKGTKYRLKDGDTYVTDWVPLPQLYTYIKENNIKLAEPKIGEICAI